ncbi:CIS tube protein [Bacilliculturomica massiliensis]|uniref:CIS tube protein n=1 Tax=Bacilliculturomica massiliensis TaxID=1917867 RepID=UPI00103248A3|nr:hypothetical protein [Bacilliculturomica massiliensis]
MGILSAVNSAKTALSGMMNNKAKFKIEGDALPLYVQFNPESYSISETVEYNQVSAQGTNSDVTQYVGSVKSVASLSFYFDTDSVLATSVSQSKIATDVSALTVKFSALLKVDGNLHRPPCVTFSWGSISITGVVVKVDTSFTMFDKKGVPVRAKVDCTLLSVGQQSAIKRSPFASPDRTKSRVLSEDTSLWELAGREYGDIEQWRLIAKANGILDPLDVPAGTALKIPALTDL